MPSALSLYRATMLPSSDIGNATAETLFKDGRGFLPLQLPLPSNGSLANKSFRVRVSGRVSTTSNVTFELRMYFGISAIIASNTLIFDVGAQTVNTTASSFECWLDCQWSADANAITGRGTGQMANNVSGPGSLNNTPLAANPNRDSSTTLASGAFYGFTVTGIFSGSSSGNHAIVDSFDLEGV